MSGEAGAQVELAWATVFVGSGVSVSVARPPGDDGSAVGRYFEATSAPYRRWLARARPGLDELFAAVVAEGELPLVPADQRFEQVAGTVLEDLSGKPDEDAAHFRRYHRGGPLSVYLANYELLGGHRSLRVRVLVSGRVRRSALDGLLGRVAAVLLAHRDEPAPPPAPTPEPAPEPPPPLRGWARVRRWFGR